MAPVFAGMLAALFLLVNTVVVLCAALVTQVQTDNAADNAALAAADAAYGSIAATPCEIAELVAASSQAAVIECSLDGLTAVVTVQKWQRGFMATASARAGSTPD